MKDPKAKVSSDRKKEKKSRPAAGTEFTLI